jgi:hypothetical protein
LLKEDLEGERFLCLLVDQLSVFEDPTGFVEEVQGLPQVAPNASTTEGGRREVFLCEDLWWNFPLERFEDFKLLRTRQPAGGELTV